MKDYSENIIYFCPKLTLKNYFASDLNKIPINV